MKKSKKPLAFLLALATALAIASCSSSQGGGACDAGGCNVGYGLVVRR